MDLMSPVPYLGWGKEKQKKTKHHTRDTLFIKIKYRLKGRQNKRILS